MAKYIYIYIAKSLGASIFLSTKTKISVPFLAAFAMRSHWCLKFFERSPSFQI